MPGHGHGHDQSVESPNPLRGEKRASQYDVDPNVADDTGQTSGSTTNEPFGSSGDVSQKDREDGSKSGSKDTGGILSQLRRLQRVHLAYVDAHRERLEKRLEENKEHRRLIEEDMKRLESTVIELLQQENSTE